ncbi:reverse transcriptase [Gossypium australe]|uniref:Reverse transcriptase n=1 Tax=Gossypium australe TaxID=47621 RepID=A0A5B6WC48_9ROSI|nr:reverse transcriptase [Gossypium australe]
MIVGQADTLAFHISNAAAESKEESSRTTAIKWKAPSHGWVKINSDGATTERGNWSSAGGVLSDSHGNWLAILHGLEIAWRKGYTKVIIESDNKSPVDMLRDDSLRSSSTTLV